ncbi:hypothetical protein ZEAMMB73_Zm00001d029646 [Zea mays]|uniref:Uridine nucleosidase 2 n=1 Tax=Zea mays TaxID=4577 RepID=A0A1D6K6G6_MAIZE|nr:hypothetical protein ZEAMMB73_Zm00001d048701 [Zea mays]ONL99185.1 hypothetical protein ZEAMMB73_Zm00001d029646 [Zea mays]
MVVEAAVAAVLVEEMWWRQLDSIVSAVSFGLMSMFLAIAILEHFLRPLAHTLEHAPPRGIRHRLLLFLSRGGERSAAPSLDLEAATKLQAHAPLEMGPMRTRIRNWTMGPTGWPRGAAMPFHGVPHQLSEVHKKRTLYHPELPSASRCPPKTYHQENIAHIILPSKSHQSTDRTEPLFDGADDTMAIFLALRSPKLEVLGLTTTFGNVHTALATRNALHLVPPPTFLPLSPPPCSGIPSNDQESHQAEDRKLCPRFRRPEDRKLRPRFRRPLWIEVRQVGAPPRIVGSTETTSSPTSSYASMLNIVTGSHIWVEDKDLSWVDGEVFRIDGQNAHVRTTKGKAGWRIVAATRDRCSCVAVTTIPWSQGNVSKLIFQIGIYGSF